MESGMSWWEQMRQDLGTLAPLGASYGVLALCVIGARSLLDGGTPLEWALLAGIVIGPALSTMAARWAKVDRAAEREDQALYLEGKMKRYSLLFAVNGGAFAVAQLLDDPNPPGGLSMGSLAAGAVVFTVLMTADIFLWGAGMRKKHGVSLFRPVGQTILLMIGALLTSGWILVKAERGVMPCAQAMSPEERTATSSNRHWDLASVTYDSDGGCVQLEAAQSLLSQTRRERIRQEKRQLGQDDPEEIVSGCPLPKCDALREKTTGIDRVDQLTARVAQLLM